MKILVFSQYYWPETFRINDVVDSLVHAGSEVTVLTGQPNYPDGVTFEGYRPWEFCVQKHPSGYAIHRVPLVPRGKGTALRLVANYLSFIVNASILGPWSLRGQRFDVIFVYGLSPILQAIAAIVLKWIKGAALVIWVQDLWPQSLAVTGFIKNSVVLGAVRELVRWIYRRSDLVLGQSLAIVSAVRDLSGATPVAYHPNPGESAFSREAPQGAPEVVLGPGFNVVFAGNLGRVQALETIVEAASLLQSHPEVRVVLIGSGSRLDWLRQEIARRGLTNIQLSGRVAPSAMPAILAQASALLVSLSRGEILSQTIPSKIQAYLAAGRPIIGSLDGEGARVVNEAGAGISCAAEDPEALAAAVRRLQAASPADRARMGEAGRSYYKQNFDPSVLAARLVQHFQQARSRLTDQTR